MHATVQSDGRSSKPTSGSTLTSQIKPGSDSVPNNGTSFPSQVKGKKRERGDQGLEAVKRERSSKIDSDFVPFSADRILKPEIVKITERGGLVDMEGVEKLVQLMMPEKSEWKLDLACRSLLAGVVAASEHPDYLNRFVQLKGLLVLDEWLQEVHQGKIAEGGSPEDNDKCVEEFLLVLLRALEKLPVNLNALQACLIGKSVNLLRLHKNLEIQRKARSLVDTWKKRVGAEMNSHGAKSVSSQAVSWSARTRHSEVSHGGNRQMGGSSDTAMKSSLLLVSASRATSVKPVLAETLKPSKLMASSVLGATNSKDGQPKLAPDPPQAATGREEKSSSSSQSQNNSQSCSGDHAKTLGFQGKDDARSSTAGSMSVNKLASGPSRNRRSVNGYQGSTLSGSQKESGRSRSPLHRTLASEKMSQSGLTCEKASDAPFGEGSVQKLVVKIPNSGRSPVRSVGGGTFEDQSVINSQASSPVTSEMHDPFSHSLRERNESFRANVTSDVKTESWQSNDMKDVVTGSDDGDGSPAAVPDEELPKAASSSSGSEPKPGKSHEASFSSMNALIESCAKCSEASASVSAADAVGMNLLASVAAGEISKSDLVLPSDSSVKNTASAVDCCMANDAKPKFADSYDLAPGETQPSYVADVDFKKTHNKPDDLITSVSALGVATCSTDMIAGNVTKTVFTGVDCDRTPDGKFKASFSEEVANNLGAEGDEKAGEVMNNVNEGLDSGAGISQKPPTAMIISESQDKTNEEVILHSISDKDASSALVAEDKAGQPKIEQENKASPACKDSAAGCSDNKHEYAEENMENKETLEHRSVEATKECAPATPCDSSFSIAGGSQMDTKLEFDLNEGFNVDDGKHAEPVNITSVGCSAPGNLMGTLPFPVSSVSSGLPASITVAAAAKGPFLPRDDLLRTKGEFGWKGSAPTSAFHPAEPRKTLEMGDGTLWDGATSKQGRPPLDIDLNVPDERVIEEVACRNFASIAGTSSCGGLDFDLNHVDEASDTGQCSTSNSHRSQAPLLPVKSSASARYPTNGEVGFRENIDLNNGPVVDDMSIEPPQFNQHPSRVLAQPPFACVRMSNPEVGTYPSWFSPGNTYSAVTIPSILPDPTVATGGPPRILGSYIGGTSLGAGAHRGGPVISSSPVGAFPSTPFQYPVPPFGSNFHLPSTSTTYIDPSVGSKVCFPGIHTQFPRPYIVSIPEGGSDSVRKWGKPGLDLNAGPGGLDIEGRDQMRQFLVAEEQARKYQVGGDILKRKDPEDGHDIGRFSYKQPSWQ